MERPKRAVWFMGIMLAAMLLTFAFATFLMGRIMTGMSAMLSLLSILSFYYILFCGAVGTSVYLLTRKGTAYKLTAAGGVLFGVLLTSLGKTAIEQLARGRVFNWQWFLSSPYGSKILLTKILDHFIFAAVVIAAGIAAGLLIKNAPRRKMLFTAGGAAVMGIFIRLLGGFIYVTGGLRDMAGQFLMIPPGFNYIFGLTPAREYYSILTFSRSTANTVALIIAEALLIGVFALLVRSFCGMRAKSLKIGIGAKIWLGVVFTFNLVVAIVTALYENTSTVALALTLAALTGVIFMWLGKRSGWYIYLTGIVINVSLNFFWPGSMQASMQLGSRLLALPFLLNPVITWLFVRKNWRPLSPEAEEEAPADDGPPARPAPAGGLGGMIFGLLVSIGLIIGGMSGEMVLRGTDSSAALIAAGFLFLIIDIIAIVNHFIKKKQYELYMSSNTELSQIEVSGRKESDNRGMRMENQSQSSAYWVSRMAKPEDKREAFVYYIFSNEPDARKALLELPFIHEAVDSRKLICDEVFSFGCYATAENGVSAGEWDAFVAGADLTHETWSRLHGVFQKYGGRKKGDKEPDMLVKAVSAQNGNAGNATYVREDRNQLGTYTIYQAPCKADAVAFLATQSVTQPGCYIVVDTPEGRFGKDIQGFYQE
jgi:hypothetical protein